MYEQETITPYEAGSGKAQQVEAMFDNIAPSYDKLNHRLSWDIDRGWRHCRPYREERQRLAEDKMMRGER